MEKRICFGTLEYNKNSSICKSCTDKIECNNVKHKTKQKSIKRVFKDYRLYGRCYR